ncbi:hypothetical protein RRG08_015609 [Elysia crispata]|uniref:Uncharacterized protein n=1 Tax=Elysia crispata TaxID=231223 RepID=A0AAE1CYP9_9GAST|nr:hypothetical protein RRG08_015609 [Elysia crispata]
MSFLFEPVSAAIQTLKHIKSASDKGPDPERFIVRLPANPGKWAMNMAFKRQHNLWKWTKYRQAKLPRKLKLKTLKIVKHGEKSDFPEQITSEFDEASSYMRVTAPADSSGLALPSGQSRPSQDSLAKDATTAQLTATVSPSSTSAGAVDADKDGS